jgi:tetratricopeptide (TPR) repeat protein
MLLLVVFFFSTDAFASKCSDEANITMPVIGAETKKLFEKKLADAKADHMRDSKDANALIWFGRRTAYLGDYKKAIHVFSEGAKMHSQDARMYRHRGHRFLSIRCFNDAITDFKKGAALIKGKPDLVEPDGLPNAQNTPTSTLQSNIWYHLGLAYYLKGDFDKALNAYRECLNVSKNNDMFVAAANCYYVTLRRAGKEKKAKKFLSTVKNDLDLIENKSYYDLIKVYQGNLKSTDLAGADGDALSNASVLYGLGNWELINGNGKQARVYFERVLSGNQWSSFGYIAAEVEMKKMGKNK